MRPATPRAAAAVRQRVSGSPSRDGGHPSRPASVRRPMQRGPRGLRDGSEEVPKLPAWGACADRARCARRFASASGLSPAPHARATPPPIAPRQRRAPSNGSPRFAEVRRGSPRFEAQNESAPAGAPRGGQAPTRRCRACLRSEWAPERERARREKEGARCRACVRSEWGAASAAAPHSIAASAGASIPPPPPPPPPSRPSALSAGIFARAPRAYSSCCACAVPRLQPQ